jgi:hypothetical protein
MKRVLAAVGLVAALAGCGGTRSTGAPGEDPGTAMARLINHEFAGELDDSFRMLIREQRSAVDHDLYVHCPPGPPVKGATVEILGVRDVRFTVPALGTTTAKAIRYRLSVPGADGTPIIISDTGHLIAQDGQWRWTLSRRSFMAMLAGACP